ncbi:MAG: RDD family protein [Isosphaeraceae bacterium]
MAAMSTSRARTAAPPESDRAGDASPGSGRSRGRDPLDTTVRLITPERIVFDYPLAGPFRRLFAYLIDLALLTAAVIAIFIAAAILSVVTPSGLGPALVAYFLLTWGYGAVCETVLNGQTLGKRAMAIRVVSDQGVPITAAQAVLRNLVGAVDGLLPFFYLAGLTSMALTRRFQRLGDLAAGTMVVVEERKHRRGVLRVEDPAVKALLPWLPLRVAAGPEMARALSDYVERRERFGPQLREEMAANLARPLRERLGLPAGPTSDAVLCAVYHRVFFGE